MFPARITVQSDTRCLHQHLLGTYVLTNTSPSPIYHHEAARIDGAIWYNQKAGWLIGLKKHIGSLFCLMCSSGPERKFLLQARRWVQLKGGQNIPVHLEIFDQELEPRIKRIHNKSTESLQEVPCCIFNFANDCYLNFPPESLLFPLFRTRQNPQPLCKTANQSDLLSRSKKLR